LTSAPAGTDSSRNAAVGGDDLRKSRLGIDAEHADTVKPHATTSTVLARAFREPGLQPWRRGEIKEGWQFERQEPPTGG
jgi:hypothetical protein